MLQQQLRAASSSLCVVAVTSSNTVIVQVAFFPPAAFSAVMLAVPLLTAVTSPVLLIVATAGAELIHLREGSVAFSGTTVANNCLLLSFNMEIADSDMLTDVTAILVVVGFGDVGFEFDGVAFFLTVTLMVFLSAFPFLFLPVVVTVILAPPFLYLLK